MSVAVTMKSGFVVRQQSIIIFPRSTYSRYPSPSVSYIWSTLSPSLCTAQSPNGQFDCIFNMDQINIRIDDEVQDPPKPAIQTIPHNQAPAKQEAQPQGWCAFLTIDYYQPYFQVTQQQVLSRIQRSLMPWKMDFMESAGESPDLYGPVWILSTIIFLLASAGNLSRYFNYQIGKQPYVMRVDYVRSACLVVYGVGFGFPAVLSLLMKYFGSKVSIASMICIYGYSLSCLILVFALCVIPVGFLQWILILYAILNSTGFLLASLKSELLSFENMGKYLVLGLIGLVQFSLLLVFKIKFFDLYYEPAK